MAFVLVAGRCDEGKQSGEAREELWRCGHFEVWLPARSVTKMRRKTVRAMHRRD